MINIDLNHLKSIESGDQIKEKLSRLNSLKNILCSDEEIDIEEIKLLVTNRDNLEICGFLNLIIDKFNNLSDRLTKLFIEKALIILRTIIDYNDISKLNNKTLSLLIDLFEKCEENINKNNYNDEMINYLLRVVGTFIMNNKYRLYGIDDKLPEMKYITLDNKIMNESAVEASIIKSIANYSVPKSFTQLTTRVFDADSYANNLINRFFINKFDDVDYLIKEINSLPDYLKSIVNNPTEEKIEQAKYIVSNMIYYLNNNITGLNILYDALVNFSNRYDINSYTIDDKEIIDNFEDFINDCIIRIDTIINNCKVVDISPLYEMGLGFIYDIVPENLDNLTPEDGDNMNRLIDEAVEYYDIFNTLNEGILHTIYHPFEATMSDKKKQKVEDDLEIRKQNKTDNLDLRKQKKSDNLDLRKQKKQDKLERKDKKKQDKLERKQREKDKKEEAKEKRKNATKINYLRWKELELTTPLLWKSVTAFKRLFKAALLGTVSFAAGWNVAFLPLIYLMGKYLQDKKNPLLERQKLLGEIRATCEQIESKLDQARSQGDHKQEMYLIKLKNRMTSMHDRYANGLDVKELV